VALPVAGIAPPARPVVWAALIGLAVLAWAFLWWAPMPMPGPGAAIDSLRYWLATALMWVVMMIGMMTPGAAPAVLLLDRMQRHARVPRATANVSAFIAGYLGIWSLFSLAATALQVVLIRWAWIDTMGVASRPAVSIVLLVAAASYQFAAAKAACLEQCRSPAEFLARHPVRSVSQAFRAGISHGVWCVGCCWLVMLLLFVGGVMNLPWVIALSAFVIAEKLAPRPQWIRYAGAFAALAWAATIALGTFA
jgi:predicted metal-binding membrane protein